MHRVFQSLVLALLTAVCYGSIFRQIMQNEPDVPPQIESMYVKINDDSYPDEFIKSLLGKLDQEELKTVNGDKTTLAFRSGNGGLRGNCTIKPNLRNKTRIYVAEDDDGNVYTVLSDQEEGGVILEECESEESRCYIPKQRRSLTAQYSCCVPDSLKYRLLVLPKPNLYMIHTESGKFAYYKSKDGRFVKYVSEERIYKNLKVARTACTCRPQPLKVF